MRGKTFSKQSKRLKDNINMDFMYKRLRDRSSGWPSYQLCCVCGICYQRISSLVFHPQAGCNCTAPFIGPSLTDTCGAGAFVVFMGTLDMFLRKQCDVADPCGRVNGRERVDFTGYDFIVVGGGSGGAVVASRLSEIPEWKVLLLEAGGDEPPGSQVPAMFPNYQDSELDWKYKTEPEAVACLGNPEQRCNWTRGKVGIGEEKRQKARVTLP